MAIKAYKYRLYPTAAQAKLLLNALNCARNLYNMAIAERKYSYQLEGRSISKYDQLRQVKCYKRTFPQARRVHSHLLQVAIIDCDKAFQAFFRRVQAGEKRVGYPRFKSAQRFSSIGFKEYGNGFQLDGHKLKLSGVGRVTVRWHRPFEGQIKTVRIVHKAGCWYACFACEVEPETFTPQTGKSIGIDVGISALITNSDGIKTENPNYYRTAQKKLRILQRKLARAQHGSKNRNKALLRVQRQQEHVANQRKDYLNKLAHRLISDYDRIALEDLRISNLVHNRRLSKSILDSGWGYFMEYLAHKAANAGRQVVFVDPAFTSRCCSNCGAWFPDFTLATRWVECDCGLSLDRDHNAAINILKRSGWVTALPDNVVPLSAPSGTAKRKRPSEATRR